jgi:hypothetical protein
MKFRISSCILYTSAILLFFTSCKEDKAIRIINNAIDAHGGIELWQNIQSLSVQKETWLFFENGVVENHLIQKIEFKHKPFFEGKITWEKDSILHQVVFDGLKTRYWMGQNEIQNTGFLLSKKNDFDAAYYVMTKPFDLLKEGKNLEYLGIINLQDGREVEAIQVIDGNPDNPEVDIWWYYFDVKSFLIIGYKVKTQDHYSMVYNKEWDRSSGILFPKRRESYRVDSLGNHLYLRAKYEFREYILK